MGENVKKRGEIKDQKERSWQRLCVGLKSWHLLNRAAALAAKCCQPAPLAWICALPFSLFSAWHFASSLLRAFLITLYQYHLCNGEWHALPHYGIICFLVCFEILNKKTNVHLTGTSVWKELVPITGQVSLCPAPLLRGNSPLCLLGTSLKNKTFAFVARCFCSCFKSPSSPLCSAPGSEEKIRPSCCPSCAHARMLFKGMDRFQAWRRDRGRKAGTFHENSHAQISLHTKKRWAPG